MNPYYHAQSSARLHGGTANDYQRLHDWMDAGKCTMANFRHRCLRHHRQGIDEAIRIFGDKIVNSDGAAVPVDKLALQHLTEDMSIIPSAADWLRQLELPEAGGPIRRGANLRVAAEDLAAWSARNFDTEIAAVLPIHQWFLETSDWFEDARWAALRHHSYGIFEAEQRFGVTIGGPERRVPTRIVGEWHVRHVLGRIPAATEFLRLIRGESWMAAAQDPHRLGLC